MCRRAPGIMARPTGVCSHCSLGTWRTSLNVMRPANWPVSAFLTKSTYRPKDKKRMTKFHHRSFPDFSVLLSGPTPPNELAFRSDRLQISYFNTKEAWTGCHTESCGTMCCEKTLSQYRSVSALFRYTPSHNNRYGILSNSSCTELLSVNASA
jgi:hypothetical protein